MPSFKPVVFNGTPNFNTNLTASFSNSASGSMSIDNGGPLVGMGSVPLRLFDTIPGDPPKLVASVGTVEYTGKKAVQYEQGSFKQLNGGSAIDAPTACTLKILIAINSNGQTLKPKVLSRDNDVAVFDMGFYGLVALGNYTREYHVLKYTPTTVLALGGGGTITYGSVAAIKENQFVWTHVNPIKLDFGEDEFEIYRLESKILINKEGEWELPAGWPTTTSYPGVPANEQPKPKVGVVSTRVHEIGMVTKNGHFYSREYLIKPTKPMNSNGRESTYVIPVTLVQGKDTGRLSEELKNQVQEILVRREKWGLAEGYFVAVVG